MTLTDSRILDYEKGKRIKTRKQIHPDLHEKLMMTEKDPNRPKITRDVYCFIWDDRGFFVKTYQLNGDQGKISFLVFNKKYDEEVEHDFPEFLDVVRDVTHETHYYSYNVTAPDYVLEEKL